MKVARESFKTIDELPKQACVYFPNSKEPVMMDAEQMYKLSDEGWYTIQYESNYGICDFWTSWTLRKWVDKRFNRVVTNKDNQGNVTGYSRYSMSVNLTRDAHYRVSEVWNS